MSFEAKVKKAVSYNYKDTAFLCFTVEQSPDPFTVKTLLTLDLKYYEKNSMQI